MKKYVLYIVFLGILNQAFSKDLRIGLFEKNPVEEITFKYNVGLYDIYTETDQLGVLQNQQDKITCYARGDKISTYLNGEKISSSVWVRLDRTSDLNVLSLYPHSKEKKYNGNFVLYAINGKLRVINEIDLDQYLEGVLKGEVGYGYSIEFYKVQSLISRTYSLCLHKHLEEGFDLCDYVHCQVYSGVSTDDNIKQAIQETSGEVIIDSSLNYLNTLYHSNCGGETVTSDYVWSKKLDNLEGIKDPHCRKSSQAKWQRTMEKDKWVKYLTNAANTTQEYVLSTKLDYNQAYRKKYYEFGTEEIKLTDIRTYFKLKSTFFSVHDVGDKIVIIGRGFGHGVGLCQEGAIAMSKSGFSYKEIIAFYYQGISIINQLDREFYLLF